MVAAGRDAHVDSRPAATRSNNSPVRMTRPAALPVNKRRRATRPEFVEASGDSELEGLFAAPGPLDRRTVSETTGARELDGLFPNEERAALGANGSPLPD
jgi:hypothetical protein